MSLVLFVIGMIIVSAFTLILQLTKADAEVDAFTAASLTYEAQQARETDPEKAHQLAVSAVEAEDRIANPYHPLFTKNVRVWVYGIGFALTIPKIIIWIV